MKSIRRWSGRVENNVEDNKYSKAGNFDVKPKLYYTCD